MSANIVVDECQLRPARFSTRFSSFQSVLACPERFSFILRSGTLLPSRPDRFDLEVTSGGLVLHIGPLANDLSFTLKMLRLILSKRSSLATNDQAAKLIERSRVASLALPDYESSPASGSQRVGLRTISLNGRRELLGPKLWPSRRHCCVAAPWMPVPEAAIDEHDGAVLRKDQIGSARKSSIVKAEPQARRMKVLAYKLFRVCVLALDRGHHSRTCCGIDYVHD